MMFTQYTVVYLEHPRTSERMNLGVAAWDMELKPNGERVPAVPEKLIWYFNRKWNRIEEIAGLDAPKTWRDRAEEMELTWSLTRLLNEIRKPVTEHTWLRFTEPHAGIQSAMETMSEVARFMLVV